MLTPEQLEQRKAGVGSSDISAIAGLNPWKTAHDVWIDKMGLSVEAQAAPDEEDLSTDLGDLAEELIAQLVAKKLGVALERSGTVAHPEHPWMMATPDRLVVGKPRLVEIKWVGWRLAHHWDTESPEGIPDYVRCQVEHQLHVTGSEDAHVASIIGGETFRIWHIVPNPDVRRFLFDHARRFWFDYVKTGTMPDVDGSEGARRMIEAVYAKTRPDVFKADAATEAWIERYLGSLAYEKRVEQEKAEAVQRITLAMGDHEVIESKRLGRGFCKRYGKNAKRTFTFRARPLTTRDDAEKAAAAALPEPDPVLVLPFEALAPSPDGE